MTFVGIYYSIAYVNSYYYIKEFPYGIYGPYWQAHVELAETLGYLSSFTNFCSCAILVLTIRHAYKVVQKLNEVHEPIDYEL
jgi:hypothetical protein